MAATGVRLKVVDAAERFLDALAGVTDPETEAQDHRPGVHPGLRGAAAEVRREAAADGRHVEFLVQGTLYPDVVESAAAPAPPTSRPTTTSAACPTTSSSSWSSRCARCSRTRCARSARSWACRTEIVWRHPFPGPGLAIRIIGEVTAERLDILRAADAIAREELTAAGLDRDVWQFPVVLLADVRSRSACRATAAPTATRSCCARCPARTR